MMFGTLIEERELFSGPIIRLFLTDDGVYHEFFIGRRGIELTTSFKNREPSMTWQQIEAQMEQVGL